MSVLVEALNRSALMQNSQSTQPQARPMPRVVPVLGMVAGACVGFGAMMAIGTTLLSSSSAALPRASAVVSPVVHPMIKAAPVAAAQPSVAEQVRLLPILEPLAADLDYYRSAKRATPVSSEPPAVTAAARTASVQAPARDAKTAASIKTLEAQVEARPDNLEAMSQLIGLISSQPPQAALTDLLRLYQAHPRQHVLAAQLGYTYSRVNDQESALRYQQWAVTLAPNNAVYLFNVAVLQDRLGKRAEATQSYQRVLAQANAGGPPVPTAAIRERLDYLARN